MLSAAGRVAEGRVELPACRGAVVGRGTRVRHTRTHMQHTCAHAHTCTHLCATRAHMCEHTRTCTRVHTHVHTRAHTWAHTGSLLSSMSLNSFQQMTCYPEPEPMCDIGCLPRRTWSWAAGRASGTGSLATPAGWPPLPVWTRRRGEGGPSSLFPSPCPARTPHRVRTEPACHRGLWHPEQRPYKSPSAGIFSEVTVPELRSQESRRGQRQGEEAPSPGKQLTAGFIW